MSIAKKTWSSIFVVLGLAGMTAAALLASGCGPSKPVPTDDFSDLGDAKSDTFSRRMKIVGTLAYGQTSDTVAYTKTPLYRAFTFTGAAKDAVEAWVRSPDGSGDSVAWLLDSKFRIVAMNDDAPEGGTFDSHITATLTTAGTYNIVFREFQRGNANFQVQLIGPSTAPPPEMTFATSRIAQADIDSGKFNADQLFEVGDFLFEHEYTVDEGLGNAILGGLAGNNPRPNARKIHNGKFGGPDSSNCHSCHEVGGRDGGGTLANNLLQDGDGVNLSSALVRNPIALLGAGYLQQLAFEMSGDLAAQLADGKSQAASAGAAQTVALSSKGTSFGSIVVNADGTVDFSGLQGVDQDLVVKPLGWKGRVASIRRFVEGGFQVHLGMATQPLIDKHCKGQVPNAAIGSGPDCTDPDQDGVRDEITEGQLTAMAMYGTLQQVPIQILPQDATAFDRVQNGQSLFTQVGCAGCHAPSMSLASPIHNEAPDLTGGAPFRVDLTVDGRLPRLPKNSDGTVDVPLFSDLKRHDMGDALADSHNTFGTFPARQFLTAPLWGVSASAPYMHDGRAATLNDAIAAHAGEAADSQSQFFALDEDSQAQVIEFLTSLTRDPQHTND
jgi:mono/diheme cytochrome c family protein